MPFLIPLPEKDVILSPENSLVLLCYEQALSVIGLIKQTNINDKDAQNPQEKAAQELFPSSETDRTGLSAKARKLMEGVTGDKWGAQTVKLVLISNLDLDPPAKNLRDNYVDFLTRVAIKEGLKYSAIKDTTINSHFLLIREISIRLVTIALCADNTFHRDGEKMLKVLSDFIRRISEVGVTNKNFMWGTYLSEFSIASATTHSYWINLLTETVTAIKILHANKTAISETLTNLNFLESTLIRHLIFELNSDTEEGALADDVLRISLDDCQKEIVSKKIKLKNDSKDLIEFQKGIEPLINLEILSIKQKETQEAVIKFFIIHKNEQQALQLRNLYIYLNKTKLIIFVLSQIDMLITSLGWVPIMTHTINLMSISTWIKEHLEDCEKMIFSLIINDIKKKNKGSIVELLNYKAASISLFNIIMRNLNDLEKLQSPELLNQLKRFIEGPIRQLISLQEAIGIQFIDVKGRLSSTAQLIAEGDNKSSLHTRKCNSTTVNYLADDDANGKLLLAKNFLANKEYEKVLESIEQLLNQSIKKDDFLLECLYIKACANAGLGKYDEALANLTQLLELDSEDYEALFFRAKIFKHCRFYEEANNDISELLQKKPDEEKFLNFKYSILQEKNQSITDQQYSQKLRS